MRITEKQLRSFVKQKLQTDKRWAFRALEVLEKGYLTEKQYAILQKKIPKYNRQIYEKIGYEKTKENFLQSITPIKTTHTTIKL